MRWQGTGVGGLQELQGVARWCREGFSGKKYAQKSLACSKTAVFYWKGIEWKGRIIEEFGN